MENLSHAALIRRACSGSDEAFSRLVSDSQQAVRAFVRRLAVTADDADDLTQEAFVTAWSRIDRLREGISFRTFVCGIAYRKALNDRRRFNRQVTRETQWHALTPQTASSTVDSRLSVQAALAQLPLDQRATVSLCLAGDYSHSEAAEILGLPLGTVKSHIAKAREKLTALLGVRS
ncbi:RNA polymerase sigma factor [Asticcacaulis sp. AC402]|uniref:RNA polymerase sigma factor n=1 Tax=Asticcacaulis sp. AC402 TaxID=1282361 RepID=UPI0003C3CA65|nr:RNA polymerase sigma factor [Asticcacaulis sp. AC402]ESQ76370.1 RNA polymerase subunit sigma-24 [Asticcacaulis sp. AC402]